MFDRMNDISPLDTRRVASLTLALFFVCLAVMFACSREVVQEDNDYPGVEETVQGLTEITGTCTYPKGESGVEALTMELVLGDGDTALVQKSSDGTLIVNGYACDDGEGTPTASAVKRIEISSPEVATAGNSVILDYSTGVYVTGASNSEYGTFVTLDEDQTNSLKIKGLSTTSADNIALGKADGAATYAIAVNTDRYADIVPVNVDELVVSLGPGNDTFSAAGRSDITAMAVAIDLPVTVYGGAGNDTFSQGSTAATALSTGEEIYGGDGTDIVDYSSRTNAVTVTINADAANDGEAGEADDIIDIDTIKGGAGGDTLTQDPALTTASTIYGYGGGDTITGGLGTDTLWGGADNDTFLTLDDVDGNDIVRGEAGTDTMSYAGRTAALVVVMDGSTSSGDTENEEADKIYTDVENLIGGDGGDTLTGNSANNTITGGEGADTCSGSTGDDIFVEGDVGADSGDDIYNGGAGMDTVTYAARTEEGEGVTLVIDGAASSGETDGDEADTLACDIENLVGTGDADAITGHSGDTCGSSSYLGDNVISGGAGEDAIDGEGGDDIIDGEGDDDTIDCGGGVDICLDAAEDCATACEM